MIAVPLPGIAAALLVGGPIGLALVLAVSAVALMLLFRLVVARGERRA